MASKRSFRIPSLGWILLPALLATLAGCATRPAAAPKTSYAFWPPLPNEPRVQFLASYRSSADVQLARSQFDQMLYGKEAALPIMTPYGVAMWEGKIYICDVRTPAIIVLDLRKHETRLVGGDGSIQKAVDIAIGPDGTKYVADLGRGGIVIFDAADHFVNFLKPNDLNPWGLALRGQELFVTDGRAKMVKVVDINSGQVLRTIGGPGGDEGQFVGPLGIRFDTRGNLVVSDAITCRIQRFTSDGKFLARFGEAGDRPGSFLRPKQLGIDRDGLLYVVDANYHHVQVFDPEDKVMGIFGSAGTHPGSMDLPAGLYIDENPADVALYKDRIHPAFEAERLIVVTSQLGGNKVAVYAAGHLKPGKTVADVTPGRANVAAGFLDPKAAATQPTGLLPPINAAAPSTAPSGMPPGHPGLPATAPTR